MRHVLYTGTVFSTEGLEPQEAAILISGVFVAQDGTTYVMMMGELLFTGANAGLLQLLVVLRSCVYIIAP